MGTLNTIFFQAHQFEDRMKSLQDRNAVLTREQVSIGVENSTLQSQSASLLAQINVLQTAQVKAEEIKGKVNIFFLFFKDMFYFFHFT